MREYNTHSDRNRDHGYLFRIRQAFDRFAESWFDLPALSCAVCGGTEGLRPDRPGGVFICSRCQYDEQYDEPFIEPADEQLGEQLDRPLDPPSGPQP